MTQIRKRSHLTTAALSVLILAVFTVTWGYCLIIDVSIDIKPGSSPNSVNLRSKGVLPVAILTTPDFDATYVDPTSVTLGDPWLGGAAMPLRWAAEDIEGDGDLDAILFFSIPELVANGALDASSTALALTGMRLDGVPFEGTDSVCIVPPGP